MSGIVGNPGSKSGLVGQSGSIGYEEGTWTPVLGVNSGGFSASQTPYGSYTKIGDRVIAEFYVSVSVSSTSGSITRLVMSSLPFTPKSQTTPDDVFGGYLTRSNHNTAETVILFAGTNPATSGSAYFRNREGAGGNSLATNVYAGVVIYRI